MEGRSHIQLDVRRGDILAGKYRVERVLGSGGMGVVIAAQHLGLNQKVAIKFLLPEALEDAEASARFDREARAAAQIKGEHMARIMDVGTLENGSPFMVMEYLEGEDLAARLRRERRLPIVEAVELVLQTCEVLAEAHALGIVHRDLKPANLFCLRGPDGSVSIKVLDFGISKFVGPNTSPTLTLTKTSALVGSPTYMSPEHIQSARTVDARTDIWAIGIVLYELLAGRVPFEGDSVPEICLQVAKRRAPPIRQFRSETPAELEAVIQKCLRKDRNRRYASVADLAVALAQFGTERVHFSVDRISRLARSGRSSASVFPGEKRPSLPPGRRQLSRWESARRSVTGSGWTGAKGAAAAAALGLTGVLLISADLAWSRWSARSPVSSAPPSSRSSAPPVPAAPGLASSLAANHMPPPVSGLVPEPSNVPTPEADCNINFSSVPVSTVVVDGHKIGKTPKIGFAAPPGIHVVVFEHPVHGRLTTSVDCKSGEAKAVTVRLGRSTDAPPGGTEASHHR
jgi:serine/threonine-protein kinase